MLNNIQAFGMKCTILYAEQYKNCSACIFLSFSSSSFSSLLYDVLWNESTKIIRFSLPFEIFKKKKWNAHILSCSKMRKKNKHKQWNEKRKTRSKKNAARAKRKRQLVAATDEYSVEFVSFRMFCSSNLICGKFVNVQILDQMHTHNCMARIARLCLSICCVFFFPNAVLSRFDLPFSAVSCFSAGRNMAADKTAGSDLPFELNA